jgi:serine/threonine-protein kinase
MVVGRDDDATVIDVRRQAGDGDELLHDEAEHEQDSAPTNEAATRIETSPTRTRVTGPTPLTLELPRPEAALREAEIEQSRRTALAGLVFNAIGLAVTPLFGGDPLAKKLFVAGLIFGLVINLVLTYATRDPRRYSEKWVIGYFAAAPLSNGPVMYYLGVFGPVIAIFVLNLYTACLGYGRRVAQVTLVASILPMVVLGGGMALGLLDDPGLITVTPQVGSLGQWIVAVLFVLFMGLIYAQASSARRILVASLVERDQAIRKASHREALLLEARQDLERALQAGGMGRFTDQTLGSYKLGAVLGRGGMGEVYEATDAEGGPAAVKLLLPEVIGQPEYVRRFLREVRIAASVESPHVVQVLEIGDESAPLPYLAMERLQGEDLAQLLRREGRLAPKELLALLRQVGKGVTAANEAGVVHRDLKPQNLFRTDGGVWKILDFGVSKLQSAGATLTQGEAVGTPHYMAPEQARGGEVDLRTDLYALGAIAYRALTGHQPFKGRETTAILIALLDQMPVRPGALAPLSDDIDDVLAIALAKDPASRFATAGELTAAMRDALAGRLDPSLRSRAATLLEHNPWAPRDA